LTFQSSTPKLFCHCLLKQWREVGQIFRANSGALVACGSANDNCNPRCRDSIVQFAVCGPLLRSKKDIRYLSTYGHDYRNCWSG
jgi:hypothetical protein